MVWIGGQTGVGLDDPSLPKPYFSMGLDSMILAVQVEGQILA